MKKIINLYITILATTFLVIACGGEGDDSPPTPPPNSAPSKVSQLLFPTADLLCIDNTVLFQWNPSTDADEDAISYKLVVAADRPLSQVIEQRTVSSTNATIILDRGIAYYWNVTAIDNQGNQAESSDTFAFYTEGDGVSNYAPFAAALNAPENNGSVGPGTVNLSWTGGDSDNGDTLTYNLFFGETSDPPLFQSDLTVENFDVIASTGQTYYWKINTTDSNGLESIGQMWQFVVN